MWYSLCAACLIGFGFQEGEVPVPDAAVEPEGGVQWMADLMDPREEVVIAAQTQLAAHPEWAIPRLQSFFQAQAEELTFASGEGLVAAYGAFQRMGPKAAGEVDFLVGTVSLPPKERWSALYDEDRERASALRDRMWLGMRLSLGATGRPGLAWISEQLAAGASTTSGVSYQQVAFTLLPNGEDSLDYVVNAAFSAVEEQRVLGSHWVRYAQEGIGEVLLARWRTAVEGMELEGEMVEADRCIALLGYAMPYGLDALLTIAEQGSPSQSRLALAALFAKSYRHLLDPKTPEYRSYTNWHGFPFAQPERPFRALERLRSPEVQARLARGLASADEGRRVLSALVMLRVSQCGDARPKELLAALADDSSVVRYWAREVIDRRDPATDRWLRALQVLPLRSDWDGIERFAERKAEWLARLQEPNAWAQAPTLEEQDGEAIVAMEAFLAYLSTVDWTQAEIEPLERWRSELMGQVVNRLENATFGSGKHYEAMARYARGAAPEIEADWMRIPRFSVGPSVYMDRFPIVTSLGVDALPISAFSLFHWRESARAYAEQAIQALGEQAAPLHILRAEAKRLPQPY